jgi:hypothetical protein
MSKIFAPELTTEESVEFKELLRILQAELKHANEEMKRDQEEIDRLRYRTRETLSRLEAA